MTGAGETSSYMRAELRPNDTLGKYRIVRRIGSGGMATIYLATSAGPGGFEKPCALKLMRPEFSEGQGAEALIKEARIAAHLNHPNIVQVYDLGRVDHDYYMTMEWVEGVALNDLLAFLSRTKRKPSIGLAAYVTMAIAEALAYLGGRVSLDGARVSLVHRDVSPSNVLISTSGVVKLADFGIVKVLDAPTSTRVGVVKGKYAYMSPEQLRGEAIDHRSDLFALGIVLWEVLTCARLFYRKSLPATVGAVSAARVPPPSELNAEVPSELDHLALRLLSKSPEHRFNNADEVVGLLQKYVVSASRLELAELTEACLNAPEEMRRGGSHISSMQSTPGSQGSQSSKPAAASHTPIPFSKSLTPAPFAKTPAPLSVPPVTKIVPAPVPVSRAPQTAAGLESDEPGRSSRPASRAPQTAAGLESDEPGRSSRPAALTPPPHNAAHGLTLGSSPPPENAEIQELEALGEYSGDELPDFHTIAEVELGELRAADTVAGSMPVSMFRSTPAELPREELSSILLPALIVGGAVAATAAFWWALLG